MTQATPPDIERGSGSYSERAFFDGEPCHHVAAYHEHLRLERIERQRIRAVAHRQWRALPDYRSGFRHARLHLVAMPADRRDALEAEWIDADKRRG